MSEENADLVRRIERLEARCDGLRARIGVTHTVAATLFGVLEAQANDSQGNMRAELLSGIRRHIDAQALSPAGREAALDALASFEPANHDRASELGDDSGQH